MSHAHPQPQMASPPAAVGIPLDFAPIIRFGPPLSTLLRFNRDEIPLRLGNERFHLVYRDTDALEAIARDHNDVTPKATPLNPQQGLKFASFRTIAKQFDNVVLAVAHALYGDVRRYNEIVRSLRWNFLGPDRAETEMVKTKVRVESLLYALCEAKERTVDLLILSPRRDCCSLYTKFSSHVLYEGDHDGFHAAQPTRTLVALEFDDASGKWSPMGYSIANNAIMGDGAGPAEGAAAVAGAATGSKEDVAVRFQNAISRLRLNGTSIAKERSSVKPTASSSSGSSSSDDEGSSVWGSEDAPRSFDAIVRDADKVYHTNPYIELQHTAVAANGPASPSRVSRVDDGGGSAAVEIPGPKATSSPPPPFHSIRYPTLDMTDCGCCQLLAETSYTHFPGSCIRLVLACLFAVVAAGLSVAILIVVWGGGDEHSCCAHRSDPTMCWNQTSDAFLNITDSGSIDAQCIMRMCPADAVLHRDATYVHLFGQLFGLGRCLCVAAAGALFCMALSVAVNHLTMRFLALYKAKPRFMYWLSALHVLVAAGLCAMSCFILWCVIDLRRRGSTVVACDWYDADSVERGLCEDAELALCAAVVAVSLPNDLVAFSMSIALVSACGLHLIVSLIPSVPSEDGRSTLPHAIPDTAIFVPGLYAPDGATQEEIERLQLDMQLRTISGDGDCWEAKCGWDHAKGKTTTKFGAEKEAKSGRGRLASVMRKVRMRVAMTRALKRVGPSSDDAAPGAPTLPSSNFHMAVHESGDRYMNSDARQLDRTMSLTFKPRAADQAYLSGATLRDVQRISSRVKDHLAKSGPPSSLGTDLSPRRPGHELRLDKYEEMEMQVEKLRHVTVVRDAVLDDIVQRIGGRAPPEAPPESSELSETMHGVPPEWAVTPRGLVNIPSALDETRSYFGPR